jgi:hypothetical protein
MDKQTLKIVIYAFLVLMIINTAIGFLTRNLTVLSPVNVAIVSAIGFIAGKKSSGDNDDS